MHCLRQNTRSVQQELFQNSLITNCPHHISLPAKGYVSFAASKGNSKCCSRQEVWYSEAECCWVSFPSRKSTNIYGVASQPMIAGCPQFWHSTSRLLMPSSPLLSLASSEKKQGCLYRFPISWFHSCFFTYRADSRVWGFSDIASLASLSFMRILYSSFCNSFNYCLNNLIIFKHII